MYASLALTATTAVTGYLGEREQQKTMHDIADRQYAADQEALDAQQQQLNASAADEMSERAREALIERGRLRTILGESGLQGTSHQRILNETFFNEGQDISSIEGNRVAGSAQIARERRAAGARRDATKAGAPQPSALGAGLQIAGAGVSAVDKYSQAKRKASLSLE